MASQPPTIVRRRVDIEFSLADNHRWTSKSAYFEDTLNVVSYFFPIGEKYFIESVQNYEDQISDPVLKQQVKDFIYQEAMHTKQHIRSNVLLDTVQPYGSAVQKISDIFLFKTRWLTPKATQLAVTCALEHFTALLATYLLRRLDSFVSLTNESFGSLWAWHAVEETEHKAVCFDVYQHIFGTGVISYLHRILVMMIVSFCTLTAVIIGLIIARKGRRETQKEQSTVSQLSPDNQDQPNVKKTYRQMLRLIKQSIKLELYLNYYRPSFHPWNHDNSHLIEDWKKIYTGFGVNQTNTDG